MRSLLECNDVVVEYATNRGILTAVRGVSFGVMPSETVAIVGESGSGKSSLGRAIVRLEKPASGTILLEGTDISRLSSRGLRKHRRTMQMVFQDPQASLNPRRTIGQLITEPLIVNRVGSTQDQAQRVHELLDRVGISRLSQDRLPHEFSGGQRQRIAIARALALSPRLIVCDEAVSALDVSVQAQVLNLLTDLQSDLGVSYVFISHDLSVVRHIAHRIVVMYLGRVMSIGPRSSFWARPTHPYTRALLAATPSMTEFKSRSARVAPSQAINDEIPSPYSPPSGCAFRTRCQFAEDACALDEPALRYVAPGEFTACRRVTRTPDGGVRFPWDQVESLAV